MASSATARAGAGATNCANAPAAATSTNSEDTATMSTSGAAHTQGRSCAPRRQSSRWNNPCSCLTFDFFNVSLQTGLLLVFLPIFGDERAHVTMQGWILGTGIGCLLYRLLYHFFKRFRAQQSNRLPLETVSVSPGFEVGELQTGHQRQRLAIQWFWRLLYVFFQLWFFGVGLGIIYTSSVTRQAPHLNWLCTVLLVIAYFPFVLVMTVCIMMSIWLGIRGAKASMILALSTYKCHAQVCDLETNQAGNKEDNDVRGISIRGDERVSAPAAVAAVQVV